MLLIRILHLLAAAIWVGGTVALVVVAVPPVRRLEGRERALVLRHFVLGPRLARQIRAGEAQTARRPLVWVGWIALALTLVVPVLGVVLAELARD